MSIKRVLLASCAVYGRTIAVASCSGPPLPPFRPVADVKLLTNENGDTAPIV